MKEILQEELIGVRLEMAELEMLKSLAAYEQNYPLASEHRDKIHHKKDIEKLLKKLIELEDIKK